LSRIAVRTADSFILTSDRQGPLATADTGTLFAQEQIDKPASPNMDPGLTAMVEDIGVTAAGIFDRVAKDWESIERPVIIDALSQSDHGCCQPGGLEGDQRSGTADDVLEQGILGDLLCGRRWGGWNLGRGPG
jgi:hypothetical protein